MGGGAGAVEAPDFVGAVSGVKAGVRLALVPICSETGSWSADHQKIHAICVIFFKQTELNLIYYLFKCKVRVHWLKTVFNYLDIC